MIMRTLLTLCVLMAAGCSTFTMPYEPVSYEGVVHQNSPLPFSLSVRTTAGQGGTSTAVIPVGSVFVPMEVASSNELIFDENDQIQFANNFGAELTRLGVLGDLTKDEIAEGLSLLLAFDETQHVPSRQKYILRGSLAITSATKNSDCPYEIDSNTGQGFGTRMTTDAFEAQKRASRMLMSRLFDCVQAFTAELDADISSEAVK